MENTAQDQPLKIDLNVHRRILNYINAARRPEDLMLPPPNEILLIDERVMEVDEGLHHDEVRDDHGHPEPKERPKIEVVFDRELAKRVLRARDEYSPLHGFRHISQLDRIRGFDPATLKRLIRLFSPRFRGRWELLYADTD